MQQSFPRPRPTTNPYLVMLGDSLRATEGVELRFFSWRSALLGHYDVFHVHWPEILVAGRTPARALVRQLLTLLLLLKLRCTRTPIVRTLHNVRRPEGISRQERAILALLERQTRLVILLNTTTVPPPDVPSEVILHGHYRDWFADDDKPPAQPGRLAYFGLIRRYKGVDGLLRAFAELPGDYHLDVAGKPSSEELAVTLSELAAADSRVSLQLNYLADAELVRVACQAELVVLPYREMHNSGGALTALSLDRPVLVPDNEVNRRLSEEVGEGWVHTYAGGLSAEQLAATLARVRISHLSARPDLSAREWQQTGPQHLAAYHRAGPPARD